MLLKVSSSKVLLKFIGSVSFRVTSTNPSDSVALYSPFSKDTSVSKQINKQMYHLFPSQINYLERDLSIATATVYIEHANESFYTVAILKQQHTTFILTRNFM